MFNLVVLNADEKNNPVSAGRIAESLLMYQKTHLFLHRHNLSNLIDQIGVGTIIELLSRPEVTADFCGEFSVVLTNNQGTYKQNYNFGNIYFEADQNDNKFETTYDWLAFDLRNKIKTKQEHSRLMNFLIDNVPLKTYSGDDYVKGGVTAASRSIFKDQNSLKALIREVIKSIPGGYILDEDYKFEVITAEPNFHIFSSIDWLRINAERKKLNAELEEVTMATVLASISSVQNELLIAAHYGGDFITSELSSRLVQFKHNEIFKKTNQNLNQIESFHEYVLTDLPSVAEIIDSKHKSFDDFFKILDKSQKFKSWLGKADPDQKIVSQYIEELKSVDNFETLPNKLMRYYLGLCLGAYNPEAALAVGVFEAFLLPSYAKKWRPSHFIDNQVKPFLRAGLN
jgi:hypothetical protein